MSAFDSYDDAVDPSEDNCPKCGELTVTRCCGGCGGEGYYDCYEEDPCWYSPGDTKSCDDCRGQGYHHWCQNCGWDLIEKLYLNGMGRIYFPASWNDEQINRWLLLRSDWRAYQFHPREYVFQGPLQLPSVASC